MWSPSHAETLCYMQAPTGMMPGPMGDAISRIHNVASSFDLFFTPDLIQLILQMTNLYGRHSVSGWSDVDAQEIRAYMRLLILTAPLTSSTRRRGVCWLCRGLKKRSSTTKCAFVGNTRSQAAGPHTHTHTHTHTHFETSFLSRRRRRNNNFDISTAAVNFYFI